jgi:hypothetical protein
MRYCEFASLGEEGYRQGNEMELSVSEWRLHLLVLLF